MKEQTATDLILQNYSFKKDKPLSVLGSYSVFKGTQTETKLPVTIKILHDYHTQLPQYLKAIKGCRSENVIKVYETAADTQKVVFITQQVNFSNLAKALTKCNRLEDNDAIFMAKMILNGYVDLKRSQCKWAGSEEDIQFTQAGVKLSWNNGSSFTGGNPLPNILQRISTRPDDTNLLPFPKSKIMLELIGICNESGSEIAMNQHMKKKERFAKKKGKYWLGLKENQNNNEYFKQTSYFAVSEDHGAIRVKVFEAGEINKEILQLNKTQRTFTRVLDLYEQGGKTIIVSQYSNDGHLQNYVNKLKTGGVTLSEDQIQFFFYSMFDPLKQIQDSSLKSLNMLHIRNIYLQNGIPKIGEPIPQNSKIQQLLVDRSEVPDFYHSEFKANPKTHKETYDTYSLGVLLYKLMFKEYPIFPNNKVHIPTTPSYNKKLKTTLEIFLNQGGRLKDIQARIQVSENVLKQIKENKAKLAAEKKQTKKKEGKKIAIAEYGQEKSEATVRDDAKSDSVHTVVEEDDIGCCTLCCSQLELSPNQEAANKHWGVIGLEQSPYRVYRICTKMMLALLLYIFLFYFFFLQRLFSLMANQQNLEEYPITIATVKYPVYVIDKGEFDTSFGKTSGTLSDLRGLDCFISNDGDNPDYSEIFSRDSTNWIGFMATALISLIVLLVVKMWQLNKFDIVKVIYNRDQNKYAFNISHFVIFNLLWACLVHGHFYFYNYIFTGQVEPCLGGQDHYSSTEKLFQDRQQFELVYVTTFVLQIVVVLLHLIMIGCTHRVKYNKLINPILLCGPFWAVQIVILRVGVVPGYFAPNILQEAHVIGAYFSQGKYIGILGFVPQILLALELGIGLLVDLIYWVFLDKRRRLLINEASSANLEAQ